MNSSDFRGEGWGKIIKESGMKYLKDQFFTIQRTKPPAQQILKNFFYDVEKDRITKMHVKICGQKGKRAEHTNIFTHRSHNFGPMPKKEESLSAA